MPRTDHCWPQIFQKSFLKSICLYLTTTKYDIWRNSLPKAWGMIRTVPSAFTSSLPFILFLFPFLRNKTHAYIFSHVTFSRPQHSNLCPVTSSFKDLNSPNCFLNPSLDVTWHKTEDVMVVMCSLPQPNTIYLVQQLGIEYPPRAPGWCYPKVWEVFTGFSQRDYRTPVTFSSAS